MDFNLFFRALKPDDANFINELRKNKEMENLIGGPKRFISLERDRKWVNELIFSDNPGSIYLAICEQGADDIIGYTSIAEIDYRNGSCTWSGIKIAPEKSGRGYGLQVALLIIKHIFEELRMVRCYIVTQEEHQVILKLVEKVGFRKEGLMRKHLFKNGVYKNSWLLSILDTDYPAIKEQYGL